LIGTHSFLLLRFLYALFLYRFFHRNAMARLLACHESEFPAKDILPFRSIHPFPEDIPDVHAHAGAIEAGIPGAKRVVVTEAGHLMYLEKPEEFSRAVITFIDANGP